MPRYKLILEYDGTRYRGWQVQANARTVQGEILAAARRALGTDAVDLQGAGRTDAGVHALGQAAHLDAETALAPERLRAALNDALPPDIHILELAKAPPGFHARKDARARVYLYQVSRRRTALAKRFVWWVRQPLDLARMERCARRFEGFHDFRSFMDARAGDKSSLVALDEVRLQAAGDLVLFRFRGSHFLWKMVRRMVGVLVAIGRGDHSEKDVTRFLSGFSPEPARLTAAPSGLFLEKVLYEGDPDPVHLEPVIRV